MRSALFLTIVGITVATTSCVRSYRDTSLYQPTGQIKPIVSIMPVINATGQQGPEWDYAREFTDEIRKRIFDSSRLYLLREGGSLALAKELSTPNPMEIPSDIKSRLGSAAPAEYVVVTEFLEQKETPYETASSRAVQEEAGALLSLTLRVRVVDLRGDTPKVVLQEIIDQEHMIAKPYLKTDYTKSGWGTDAYASTPLGMAHSKVVRELVAHVESYIIAAR